MGPNRLSELLLAVCLPLPKHVEVLICDDQVTFVRWNLISIGISLLINETSTSVLMRE
jgi:hypothetical protein